MQNRNEHKINGQIVNHFDYEEFGAQGVGKDKKLIVPMDKYFDHSMSQEIHTEILMGLALCEDYYKMGQFIGDIPPEFNETSWSRAVIDNADPIHQQALEKLAVKTGSHKALYRYAYFAMGACIPWFFGLYLMDNSFFTKTEEGKYNEDVMKHFPLLRKFLSELPFKKIGRVMFFNTYPGAGVMCHRDAPMQDHKDHNINFFFEGGSRPSYIWDEIKKEKVYLPEGSKSYFFNNRDYHGVDPEPNFRYTLRVDGTFTDELCEELGLINGWTWNKSY